MFTVVIAALRPSTSQRLPHYRGLNSSSSSSPPQAQSVLKVCRFAPPKLCCWLTRRLNRPTSPHPEQPASPPKNSHSPSPFRTHQKEKKKHSPAPVLISQAIWLFPPGQARPDSRRPSLRTNTQLWLYLSRFRHHTTAYLRPSPPLLLQTAAPFSVCISCVDIGC